MWPRRCTPWKGRRPGIERGPFASDRSSYLRSPLDGRVAEWLGTALQKLLLRFESARDLDRRAPRKPGRSRLKGVVRPSSREAAPTPDPLASARDLDQLMPRCSRGIAHFKDFLGRARLKHTKPRWIGMPNHTCERYPNANMPSARTGLGKHPGATKMARLRSVVKQQARRAKATPWAIGRPLGGSSVAHSVNNWDPTGPYRPPCGPILCMP